MKLPKMPACYVRGRVVKINKTAKDLPFKLSQGQEVKVPFLCPEKFKELDVYMRAERTCALSERSKSGMEINYKGIGSSFILEENGFPYHWMKEKEVIYSSRVRGLCNRNLAMREYERALRLHKLDKTITLPVPAVIQLREVPDVKLLFKEKKWELIPVAEAKKRGFFPKRYSPYVLIREFIGERAEDAKVKSFDVEQQVQLCAEFGRVLGKLHKNGFAHRMLSEHNYVVLPTNPLQVRVLDLDYMMSGYKGVLNRPFEHWCAEDLFNTLGVAMSRAKGKDKEADIDCILHFLAHYWGKRIRTDTLYSLEKIYANAILDEHKKAVSFVELYGDLPQASEDSVGNRQLFTKFLVYVHALMAFKKGYIVESYVKKKLGQDLEKYGIPNE